MVSLQLAIVNINEYPDALTLKINSWFSHDVT